MIRSKLHIFIFILFYTNSFVFSQSIGKTNINFSNYCFSPDIMVTSEAFSTVSGFSPTQSFVLELSDPGGRFNSPNPIVVGSPIQAISGVVRFINFELPPNVNDTFTLRISSTTGISSSRSNPFPAYFYDGRVLSLGPSSVLCVETGNTTRLIANIENSTSGDSYFWFRENTTPGGGNTFITETDEPFLDISTSGVYFFSQLDYRSCSGLIMGQFSPKVQVTVLSMTASPTIVGPNVISVCDNDPPFILQSSITDPTLFYQWTKNGNAILGKNGTALNIIPNINADGEYRVGVSESPIGLTTDCVSQSPPVNVILKNPKIEITSQLNVVELPGEPVIITAQVSGADPNPTITWIKNGIDILPPSNTNTFTTTGPGEYEVRITGSTSCGINEFRSEQKVTVSGIQDLKANIDYEIGPDYKNCEFNEIRLLITQITSKINGVDTPIPTSSFENLDIVWLKDDIVVDGEKNSSILIDNPVNNGDYKVQVTASTEVFETPETDKLPVVLGLGALEVTQNPEILSNNNPVTLSIQLPANVPEANFTIEWIRNSSNEIIGTDPILKVFNEGSYRAKISLVGCEDKVLGPFNISAGPSNVPNLITPNLSTNNRWVLPSQFALKQDVEVTIYAPNGEVDFSSNNYNGEWPLQSATNLKGTIYYYVISGSAGTKQGTITIIR